MNGSGTELFISERTRSGLYLSIMDNLNKTLFKWCIMLEKIFDMKLKNT